MTTRRENFVTGEYFHIYNRGVDKRDIFSDKEDIQRFLQSIVEFNESNPIGSLYERSFQQLGGPTPKLLEEEPLVRIIAYCLNPNHYHLILEQVKEGGISEFMKRLGGGYTGYFNNKYERSGALFQGKFKAAHIDSNEYLLQVSAYVNLNDRVHKLDQYGDRTPTVESLSSWGEYMGTADGFCTKNIVLDQFNTRHEYESFARSALETALERKDAIREATRLFIE